MFDTTMYLNEIWPRVIAARYKYFFFVENIYYKKSCCVSTGSNI